MLKSAVSIEAEAEHFSCSAVQSQLTQQHVLRLLIQRYSLLSVALILFSLLQVQWALWQLCRPCRAAVRGSCCACWAPGRAPCSAQHSRSTGYLSSPPALPWATVPTYKTCCPSSRRAIHCCTPLPCSTCSAHTVNAVPHAVFHVLCTTCCVTYLTTCSMPHCAVLYVPYSTAQWLAHLLTRCHHGSAYGYLMHDCMFRPLKKKKRTGEQSPTLIAHWLFVAYTDDQCFSQQQVYTPLVVFICICTVFIYTDNQHKSEHKWCCSHVV